MRFITLSPDEAAEKVLPELENRVCDACPVKYVCPLFDKGSSKESCSALRILEQIFLTGKISFKEATSPEKPPSNEKIVYNLDGLEGV